MDIAALVISGISLVLAVISFVISVKSQNLQNKVNEIELKLKKYELEEKEKQACVEARIIHEIKNRYKIKVWNSGNSIAKNVVASWDQNRKTGASMRIFKSHILFLWLFCRFEHLLPDNRSIEKCVIL